MQTIATLNRVSTKSAEPPEPTARRLEALDSIRGLAAVAVLFNHTCEAFAWPTPWYHWIKFPLLDIATDGRSAVTMFFVLSGFVLARPYVSSAAAPVNVPVFYLRRLIRIWLPWFGAFVISLVGYSLVFHAFSTQPAANYWYWQNPLSLRDVLLQPVFMLHNAGRQLIPQDWSLGVELIGSALIPLFVVLARQRWDWLWMTLMGLALIFGIRQYSYFNSGAYYVSFILGVLLARHHVQIIARLKQLKFYHRLIVLLMGLAFYQARKVAEHFGNFDWTKDDRAVWITCSFGCALIIAASLSSGRIGRFLTTRPVLWIGRVSYSVYLLQFIILLCVLPPVVMGLNRLGLGASPGLLFCCLAFGLVFTLALAWPFYRFVELPSIALGHWVSAKLKKNRV